MPKKKIEENIETKSIDTIKEELKEELFEEVDNHIKISINKELEKTNKKIIRNKNRKIIIRDIIIVVLLALCIYLLYLLKNNHYFDKYFINDKEKIEITENNIEKEENKEIEVEVEKQPSLDELKEKYGYLLNNIYLNEKSSYIDNFYNNKLTNEIKHYFIINYLNKNNLKAEDNYNIISSIDIKEAYEKLFADTYEPISFDYNDNKIRYISKLDSYITDEVITTNSTNIIKEIIDINVKEDKVLITTIEGINKNNKIYNILTNEEICEYNASKLLENIDKLNKVIYMFDNNNRLISITK